MHRVIIIVILSIFSSSWCSFQWFLLSTYWLQLFCELLWMSFNRMLNSITVVNFFLFLVNWWWIYLDTGTWQETGGHILREWFVGLHLRNASGVVNASCHGFLSEGEYGTKIRDGGCGSSETVRLREIYKAPCDVSDGDTFGRSNVTCPHKACSSHMGGW